MHFVNRLCRGEDPSTQSGEVFTIVRLFEAVASGEVGQLSELYEYLRLNMKYLSDTFCERHAKQRHGLTRHKAVF